MSLEDMKSPKIPEYSHLPPDPNPDSNTDVKPDIKLNLKLDLKPDLKPDSNHNSRPSCNKIGINNSDRRNDIVPNLRPNSRHDSRTNLHSNTHSGENGAGKIFFFLIFLSCLVFIFSFRYIVLRHSVPRAAPNL